MMNRSKRMSILLAILLCTPALIGLMPISHIEATEWQKGDDVPSPIDVREGINLVGGEHKDKPIFTNHKGSLLFIIKPTAQWKAVAFEIPKEFRGLVHNKLSVYTSITNNYNNIKVKDEALYHPYNSSDPWWVEVRHSYGLNITERYYVMIRDLTAPSVAANYTIKAYATTNRTFWYTLMMDCGFPTTGQFKPNSTTPNTLTYILPCYVSMREEPSIISGTLLYSRLAGSLANKPIRRLGLVEAIYQQPGHPMHNKVVAKGYAGFVKKDGTYNSKNATYSIYGLFARSAGELGTYLLRARAPGVMSNGTNGYPPQNMTFSMAIAKHGRQKGVTLSLEAGGVIKGNISWLVKGTPTALTSNNLTYTVVAYDSKGTAIFPIFTRKAIVGEGGPPTLGKNQSWWWITGTTYGGLPDGKYTIKCYAFGYVQVTPIEVTVAGGGTVGGIVIPMNQGGTVSGTLNFYKPDGTTAILPKKWDGTSGDWADTINPFLIELQSTPSGQVAGITTGTIGAGYSSTTFKINGFNQTADRPLWGRGLYDYGIPDGSYLVKVYVRGFLEVSPTAITITGGGLVSNVNIAMKRGGIVTGEVEPYVSGAVSTFPAGHRLRLSLWDSGGKMVDMRDSNASAAGGGKFKFTGVSGEADALFGDTWPNVGLNLSRVQGGAQPAGIRDGAYTIKVEAQGYVQELISQAVVSVGGVTSGLKVRVERAGEIGGTMSFLSAGTAKQLKVRTLVAVEAYDSKGDLKGVFTTQLASDSDTVTYNIKGFSRYTKVDGTYIYGGGLGDGEYTIKVRLIMPYDQKPPWYDFEMASVINLKITGKGVTGGVSFGMNQMGTVTGLIIGKVTYQTAGMNLTWVEVKVSSPDVVGYSYNGLYWVNVSPGTHSVTFNIDGYAKQTITVTVVGGSVTSVSPTLEENFVAIPEFPLSAAIMLLATLGLALYITRSTKKLWTLKTPSYDFVHHACY